MTRVKICGVTRLEDALLAAELGASAIGFVFWPESPRFLDPYRARRIAAALPPLVMAVGVFVDQPIEYVEGVASLARLGAVQLHGSEPAGYLRQVSRPMIKAVSVDEGFDPATVHALPAQVIVLLDAHDPARRGGTGQAIDWRAAAGVARSRRTLLAGGLAPDNVARAIAEVRPFGVDVSSGVEARPGVKDPARLRALFDAVRAEDRPA